MYKAFQNHLKIQLKEISEAGLYKNERVIVSPQSAEIELNTGQKVLNFCANNYLGLSNDPSLIEAAKKSLDDHGYGMSSVRFICGTTDLHKELEKKLRNSSALRIQSSMQPVLTQTVEYLNHSSRRRMQLFLIP